MSTRLLPRLLDALLSREPKQRLRITRSLLAANVFVACCLLQVYAAWIGFMDFDDVWRLSGVILANCLFWYGFMRSGANLRYADPAMTLPQILSALTIIGGAYAVTARFMVPR